MGIVSVLELILSAISSSASFAESNLVETIAPEEKKVKKPKIKVCVIGAGAAGISALRHLATDLETFQITVFEKSNTVGGTWVYSDKTGTDEYGLPVHTSMYKYLSTNLPKEIMNFPDRPTITGYPRSCVPHRVILKYLKGYVNHFRLKSYIQFNTMVMNVALKKNKRSEKWVVTVRDLKAKRNKKQIFDAVIVANGHYFNPFIPDIPGLDKFKGTVLHSHSYRTPAKFRNKTVIILGAGSSGIDIGQELMDVSCTVYISHNKEPIADSYGFIQVAGIVKFENGKFVLNDNSRVEADVLLFCTGYNYSYPFLDASTDLVIDQNFVYPLYKHIVNIEHPSMNFVGIAMGITPFPLFHCQSQFVKALLSGKVDLPSEEEMLDDAQLKTGNKRYAHMVTEWSYCDELARMAGFPPLPRFYKAGHEIWMAHRSVCANFKEYNLIIKGDLMTVQLIHKGPPPRSDEGALSNIVEKLKQFLWLIQQYGIR